MSRLEEIEKAIEALSAQEFAALSKWMTDFDDERWVEQIERDAAAGRLDFLLEEAENERAEGLLKEWP